jgi:hypothetical protein
MNSVVEKLETVVEEVVGILASAVVDDRVGIRSKEFADSHLKDFVGQNRPNKLL